MWVLPRLHDNDCTEVQNGVVSCSNLLINECVTAPPRQNRSFRCGDTRRDSVLTLIECRAAGRTPSAPTTTAVGSVITLSVRMFDLTRRTALERREDWPLHADRFEQLTSHFGTITLHRLSSATTTNGWSASPNRSVVAQWPVPLRNRSSDPHAPCAIGEYRRSAANSLCWTTEFLLTESMMGESAGGDQDTDELPVLFAATLSIADSSSGDVCSPGYFTATRGKAVAASSSSGAPLVQLSAHASDLRDVSVTVSPEAGSPQLRGEPGFFVVRAVNWRTGQPVHIRGALQPDEAPAAAFAGHVASSDRLLSFDDVSASGNGRFPLAPSDSPAALEFSFSHGGTPVNTLRASERRGHVHRHARTFATSPTTGTARVSLTVPTFSGLALVLRRPTIGLPPSALDTKPRSIAMEELGLVSHGLQVVFGDRTLYCKHAGSPSAGPSPTVRQQYSSTATPTASADKPRLSPRWNPCADGSGSQGATPRGPSTGPRTVKPPSPRGGTLSVDTKSSVVGATTTSPLLKMELNYNCSANAKQEPLRVVVIAARPGTGSIVGKEQVTLSSKEGGSRRQVVVPLTRLCRRSHLRTGAGAPCCCTAPVAIDVVIAMVFVYVQGQPWPKLVAASPVAVVHNAAVHVDSGVARMDVSGLPARFAATLLQCRLDTTTPESKDFSTFTLSLGSRIGLDSARGSATSVPSNSGMRVGFVYASSVALLDRNQLAELESILATANAQEFIPWRFQRQIVAFLAARPTALKPMPNSPPSNFSTFDVVLTAIRNSEQSPKEADTDDDAKVLAAAIVWAPTTTDVEIPSELVDGMERQIARWDTSPSHGSRVSPLHWIVAAAAAPLMWLRTLKTHDRCPAAVANLIASSLTPFCSAVFGRTPLGEALTPLHAAVLRRRFNVFNWMLSHTSSRVETLGGRAEDGSDSVMETIVASLPTARSIAQYLDAAFAGLSTTDKRALLDRTQQRVAHAITIRVIRDSGAPAGSSRLLRVASSDVWEVAKGFGYAVPTRLSTTRWWRCATR
jgi:hypothetical protein